MNGIAKDQLTCENTAESVREFVGQETLRQLTKVLLQQISHVVRLKLVKVDGI